MSDRSFRDRLLHIADIIDLEQLDGLVIRAESSSADEEHPSLHRLFMGLEEVPAPNSDPFNTLAGMAHNHFDVGAHNPDPDVWGLFGVNRTPLNRAILEGKFDLAEKLISASTNPESLNDGSMGHALTPGKGSYRLRPRNFRIVKLLLEKGASPNQHSLLDLPSSPFEIAINYYLQLLKYQNSLPFMAGFRYGEYELLNAIGFEGEELNNSVASVIIQTKQLIHIFLDHGANFNLQTTNCGRTIFHEVIASQVTDRLLVDRMISLGALVNLTDMHGTTPFMDVICHNNRSVENIFTAFRENGKRVLIDAQNCIGETALWRSMFYGKLGCSQMLIDENVNFALVTRVTESSADFFAGTIGFRPFGLHPSALKRRPSMKPLPAVLAPLLFDSPCLLVSRSRCKFPCSMVDKFSVKAFNQVVGAYITPVVEYKNGAVATEELGQILANLIKNFTDYSHLINKEMFQICDLPTLLLGNRLSQLAIRRILNKALFEKTVDDLVELTGELKGYVNPLVAQDLIVKAANSAIRSMMLRQCKDITTRDSAASVVSAVLSDFSDASDLNMGRVTLSEPDMSAARSSTPFPLRTRYLGRDSQPRSADDDVGASARSIGGNWYLRETPQYSKRSPSPMSPDTSGRTVLESSLDGIELEISHESGRSTVTRLQRLLQETDDRLERLQSEVNGVTPASPTCPSSSSPIESECAQPCADISTENPLNSEDSDDDDSSTTNELALNGWMPCIVGPRPRRPFILDTDESDGDPDRVSGTKFKLPSSTNPYRRSVEFNQRGKITPKVRVKNENDPRFDEMVVRQLSPRLVDNLRVRLGLPRGLLPYLELEVARLQLGASIFHYSSMKCDRGCEGYYESESDFTTSDDEDESDNSLSQPLSSNQGSDSSSLTSAEEEEGAAGGADADDARTAFVPAVPEMPRILSSSSSASSPDFSPDFITRELSRFGITDQPAASENGAASSSATDFFHFGALNEHETISRYMQQMVADSFDLSTESDTDDEESNHEGI